MCKRNGKRCNEYHAFEFSDNFCFLRGTRICKTNKMFYEGMTKDVMNHAFGQFLLFAVLIIKMIVVSIYSHVYDEA